MHIHRAVSASCLLDLPSTQAVGLSSILAASGLGSLTVGPSIRQPRVSFGNSIDALALEQQRPLSSSSSSPLRHGYANRGPHDEPRPSSGTHSPKSCSPIAHMTKKHSAYTDLRNYGADKRCSPLRCPTLHHPDLPTFTPRPLVSHISPSPSPPLHDSPGTSAAGAAFPSTPAPCRWSRPPCPPVTQWRRGACVHWIACTPSCTSTRRGPRYVALRAVCLCYLGNVVVYVTAGGRASSCL